MGEDTGILEAEDAFDGEAVGDAEGLLGFTELELGLAAAEEALLEEALVEAALLVDAFDETADECKVEALDFGVDLTGLLLAGAADLVEETDLEACRMSIS